MPSQTPRGEEAYAVMRASAEARGVRGGHDQIEEELHAEDQVITRP